MIAPTGYIKAAVPGTKCIISCGKDSVKDIFAESGPVSREDGIPGRCFYSAVKVMLTVAVTISFAACTIVPLPVAASSFVLLEKLPTSLL